MDIAVLTATDHIRQRITKAFKRKNDTGKWGKKMNHYEKPIVLANEDIAEGVYAASGSADCWSVAAYSVQDWNGSHNVFEVDITHSDSVEHISTASTVTLAFNNALTDAYTENNWDCSYSGNTVTVTRESHANAYQSGDHATYKVWVKAADEATTKALSCTGATISCTKTVNVQGKGGDGN